MDIHHAAGALALALCLSVASSAHAGTRQWTGFTVPGASCGDGSPYRIFISRGDPKKVAFDLMGGGACWDLATCFAPEPHAWMHAIPGVFERSGFVSLDPEKSPVSDYTIVYFPYCTGDVHLGTHVASYAPGVKAHHTGLINFTSALTLLAERDLVRLDQAKSFVLYGYSAGALGALYHAFTLEPWLKSATNKVLVADSPGLHFGSRFWNKFPDAWLADIERAMDQVGFHIHRGQGDIAGVVPAVCKALPSWRVAVLQGSRDVVMSLLFGDITPDDERAEMLGPQGLYALTADPTDNCSAWIPDTAMHTFLVTDLSSGISAGGKTARDFARDAVEGTGGLNYH